LSVSQELYEKTLGADAAAELEAITEAIYSTAPEKTYSVTGFAKPVSSGKLAQPYGTRIIVNVEDSPDTYLLYSIGDTYSVDEGAGVYASAKGRIAYTGECGTLGKVVIVDHGCGVFSWYYGLDTIERGADTEVGPSTLLGTAGKNQYDGTFTVGFCVMAGKVFVDPFPETNK
jgi:septal ring factor EnvC (AmiA/AmiB activator)